jgi:hypothetical protein
MELNVNGKLQVVDVGRASSRRPELSAASAIPGTPLERPISQICPPTTTCTSHSVLVFAHYQGRIRATHGKSNKSMNRYHTSCRLSAPPSPARPRLRYSRPPLGSFEPSRRRSQEGPAQISRALHDRRLPYFRSPGFGRYFLHRLGALTRPCQGVFYDPVGVHLCPSKNAVKPFGSALAGGYRYSNDRRQGAASPTATA